MLKGLSRAGCCVMFFFLVSWFVSADDFRADFDNVPLSDYAMTVGKNLGKTVVIDEPLKGHVTLQSETMTSANYYDLFLSVLRSNGYSVIEKDNIMTVVSSKKAASDMGYLTDRPFSGHNRIVTRSVSLSHLQATDVSSTIKKMLGDNKDASVTAIPGASMLIVTGFQDTVEKIIAVADLANDATGEVQASIPLKYAVAKPLATELKELIMNSNQGNRIKVTADTRTNMLLVRAVPEDLSRMKALIAKLDIPEQNSDDTDEDSDGNVMYLKYAQAKSVAEVLQKIITADQDTLSNVVADEKVNAVIINAYGDEQLKLRNLVKKLDIRRAQVHVEAMIVEIADADGINFGVQWGSTDGSLVQFSNGTQLPLGALAGAMYEARSDKGSTIIDENGNTTVNPDSKGDLSTLLSLLSGYNGAAVSVVKGDWMALVQAMKSTTSANILSTPSLTTLDNQKAEFMVGEEVPVITGSTVSSDNTNPFQTVDRRNVGTKLTITPQINSGNAVQLQLSAEVSKIEGNTGVDVVFAERKLNTTIMADSGSMVILGGLIDEQQDTSHSSVPVLGDIPFIGRLFSSDNTSKQKRNLMIFIRPTILRSDSDADQLSEEKYRYIHAQNLFHDTFNTVPALALPGGAQDELTAFRRVNAYG